MANNYVQGGWNSTESSYNLLISGAPGNYQTSSVYLGADTHCGLGSRFMFNNASNNAFMDLRAADGNSMTFRYTTDGYAMNNMLQLVNDTSLSNTSRYAATVGGRVNASAFYVNGTTIDSRAPTAQGLYMGLNTATVGQFNINKGTGTGGFQFNTYTSNGTLAFNNMNLLANGQVQAVYYNYSGNSTSDFETVAIAGFDTNGNMVRNYAANQRFRLAEARLTAIENDLVVNGTSNIVMKVNDIINRLNGLNFFSCNIVSIANNAGNAFFPCTTVV